MGNNYITCKHFGQKERPKYLQYSIKLLSSFKALAVSLFEETLVETLPLMRHNMKELVPSSRQCFGKTLRQHLNYDFHSCFSVYFVFFSVNLL